MKKKSVYLLTVAAISLVASLSAPVAFSATDTLQDAARPGSGFASLIGALNTDQQQSEKIRSILNVDATQSAQSRHATYQRLLAVLSAAQRSEYEALIQQRFDQHLQEMADALNLTQDQKAELGAILTLADDRFAPSIAGSDLTDAIRAVLSEEQVQKLAALSPDARIVENLWR